MTELYGQRIQTTVQTKYLPFVVDTILNSNVLLQRVVRASKKWSGRTLRVPIKVSKNVTGQSFKGFDTFSVAATDNRQYMEFTPSFYQITCALPGDELLALIGRSGNVPNDHTSPVVVPPGLTESILH